MRSAFVLLLVLFPIVGFAQSVADPATMSIAVASPDDADLVNDDCTIPTGCGAWPDDPTYSTTNPYANKESSACKLIKVVDQATCEARCLCNHNDRVKKCSNNLRCIEIQKKDYEACLTFCMVDNP